MENPAAPLPKLVLHPSTDRDSIDPTDIVKTWLKDLGEKISRDRLEHISDLFIDDCWWRDIVGLSWNITTKYGTNEVSKYLLSQAISSGFGQFEVFDQGPLKPRLSDISGIIWIESGFSFKTKVGSGRGIVRLANVLPLKWKAWIVHTNLDGLNNFPERSPEGKSNPCETKDIQVLIIGAGQSGLALAAQLKSLNVNTLTVDKLPQLGGSWRDRYKTIRSHTPRYTDLFPYVDYPSDYPQFLAQENLVSWMENYQKAMDLNVELGVTIDKIDYDDLSRQYTVRLKLQDGTEQIIAPHHLVLATGLFSTTPTDPEFENKNSFAGQIYHSVNHKSADLFPDLGEKKVVVIGASTSAHDIAQDFVSCGAKNVTMIQRSPLFVVSAEALDKFLLASWQQMPIKDADLVGTSVPFPIALTLALGATHMMAQHDAELLSRLEKAGLAIKRGEDGTGLLHHQLLKAGHFYIDQGACDMIADGRIKIQRSREGAKGFDHNAVILGDDTRIEADIVVVATGFKRCSDMVEKIMGKEFAAKVGEVGGLDAEGERIAWWRPSAAPGFWYMTGSFIWSRTYSKPLALQIKAIEEGLNVDYYTNRKSWQE